MGESTVGWDADPVVAETTPWPELEADLVADVCVIGLGGSGLAAVGDVLDRGLSVVGIDAGRVAAGAAGRNGGLLVPGPGIGVVRAAELWGMDALGEFYRSTQAEIVNLRDLLGADVIRPTGGLRIVGMPGEADDPARQADLAAERVDCAAQQAILTRLGVPVEPYEGPLGTGAYFPGDAAMNPARRALGMAVRYGRSADLFERSPVTAIQAGLVRTSRGSVSAGAVVVAVDGRLEVLLPELAGRVRTVRLQMLATAPVAPGVLPCPLHVRWGFDYVQQDAAGRLFIGGGRDRFAGQEWTTDTTPTAPVQGWIESQARLLAGGPVAVTHRWAASAGYAADDGRPLVARVRDRVVACGGYSGTGNLVGPLAARAAVALALDGTLPRPYFAS